MESGYLTGVQFLNLSTAQRIQIGQYLLAQRQLEAAAAHNAVQTRRRHPRIKVAPGVFKTQGFEARDLSESGLMLARADMHPAGCELTVELEIDNKRICLNAVIHWCRPSHLDNGRMYLLGLEFVSMQRPHQQLLRDYIAKMLAREALRAA